MVVVGRAQAPPPWDHPLPTHPSRPPPQLPPPPPPPRVLTDSWGVVASGPLVVAPPSSHMPHPTLLPILNAEDFMQRPPPPHELGHLVGLNTQPSKKVGGGGGGVP